MDVLEVLLAVFEEPLVLPELDTALPGASIDDVESRALGSTELIRLTPRNPLPVEFCCCDGAADCCCFPDDSEAFDADVLLPITDEARCEIAVSAAAAILALA